VLALWQTDHVIARLLRIDRSLHIVRRLMSSPGDRDTGRPLSRLGDKGAFTRDLEDALAAGTIDAAVHSLKDLPTTLPPGLIIGAVLEREDPRDVLVSPAGYTLRTLPEGAVVGTSSLRRRAQVLARRPDLELRDLRGNVPTRLAKVVQGEYVAAVMAHAGLLRLGRMDLVAEVFDAGILLPAAGQGALAVETRAGDARTRALLAPLEHGPTRLCTAAERALLVHLEGGCQVPVAALATLANGILTVRGLVADLDGREIVREELSATVRDIGGAEALGQVLAEALIAKGAGAILARVRASAWPAAE